MAKFKKFKKNKKLIIASVISLVFVSGVIISFALFGNYNDDSVRTYNENLSSSDSNLNDNQSQEEEKNNNSNVKEEESRPVSANENDIKNKNSSEKQNNLSNNFLSWNNSCEPFLVVINKDNPVPDSFNAKMVDYSNVKVNSIIVDDLDNMIKAAADDGLKIYPSSGYRSVARQTTLFNNQVEKCKKNGYKNPETEAAKVVAKPGTSEHHTGFAIDFNGVEDDFYKTKEYAWLMKNAADYGFILRYPQDKTNITNVIYEPWHFRYIGKEHAKKMAGTDLCYEEYVESIIKK